MKKLNILFVLSIFFFGTIQGQHLLQTQGKVIVNQQGDTILLRGMGLGGWMLQEGYMLQTAAFASAEYQIREAIEGLIGETNTDLFYEKWLANHCRKADIDSLKAWGFNSVRLPMHYKLFTLPIEEEPVPGQQTWLNKGFELTDSLISWCKQNEMYVILDLHGAPGGQGYDQGISDYDPTKPSLWESQDNKDKMVALWKQLAIRYADEQWVGGYDLLNEPNWDLPGGTALRSLYQVLTDTIRSVDPNHIIIIEGNWFANDFTGLTPPWDDNLVYGPHKYWSINDQASIQWVLNIRNQYDVPLYLGESGENSNVWFRDAIRLLEDNKIGWAWWPMKKIESISGPASVTKTTAYQSLLNYWENGGTQPTVDFAKNTLMELAENLKIENCHIQKDVIDAMFRQVQSDELVPFKQHTIPGVIHASDFEMGVVGEAYWDTDVANYNVTTGVFTTWNTGWTYRNDGVDIEASNNVINSNGYHVAWVNTDEWMKYNIDVAADGVYDINVRLASGTTGGNFHFEAGDAAITIPWYSPNTGGWQSWQTLTIPDVVLKTTDKYLKFYVDNEGFNISSFEFVPSGSISDLPTEFMAAQTVDANTIQMNINKFFDAASFPASPANFEIFADGTNIPITNVEVDSDNPRLVYFTVDATLKASQTIRISYDGTQITSEDGVVLETFFMELVKNTLSPFLPIPGKIEAEDFSYQEGVQLETTTDVGGGENIGYLDSGDFLDYLVDVSTAGTYQVNYRTASEQPGSIALQLVDDQGNTDLLHIASFPATGGWQVWSNNMEEVDLPAGQHTMRLLITQAPFNMNWMEFSLVSSTEQPSSIRQVQISPNPTKGILYYQAAFKNAQKATIEIYNILGQPVLNQSYEHAVAIEDTLDLSKHPSGYYIINIKLEDGSFYSEKVLKF